MKILSFKNKNRTFIVAIILLLFVFVSYLIVFLTPSTDYVMFVYLRDSSSRIAQVKEVRSGFTSLLSCQQAGRVYANSVNGKPVSYFRCGTGCPLDADTEKDCKVHD